MKTLKKVSVKVQRMPISSFLGRISAFSVTPEMSSLGVFFEKRSYFLFWQKGDFIFVEKKIPPIATYRKHHISMYFLNNIISHFSSVKKISYFRKKEMHSFLIISERSYSSAIFLERSSFRKIWRIYHISIYSFWEKSSFIFPLKNNIIFSGKRNIIFPEDATKVIFQCHFFGKIIFSKHLEKENIVFRAVFVS